VVFLGQNRPDGPRGRPYPLPVAVDHHDHDRIVELTRVPTRFEADMLIAKLQSAGIQATARYGDADGWVPQLAAFGGNGVMVFDSDLEKATALIAEP
jgi:hypothetical protein